MNPYCMRPRLGAMSESPATPTRPAAKANQVKGPFDVTPGGLRVLDATLAKHQFKVRIAVEGAERISLSDFESIDDLLVSKELLALRLTRLEIRCRNRSGDRSVSITLGGWSSGEVSVHAPSLEDAEKLLNETEAALKAMRSERRWPHSPITKYPLGIALYFGALILIAKMLFLTLGAPPSQASALAVWLFAGLPLWYLIDVYKMVFPEPRFLIGRQAVPPKWAVALVGTLLISLFYDIAIKPLLHWAGLWPAFAG